MLAMAGGLARAFGCTQRMKWRRAAQYWPVPSGPNTFRDLHGTANEHKPFRDSVPNDVL